jgi:putative transposase
MAVFRDDEERHPYLQLLIEQARLHRLRFLSWCLMTNHVHLVVVPPEALARGIGEAHRRYTWRVNRKEGVCGYLFQGRFFSCPLDEEHGLAAIRYVERNPVRAGIVAEAWEYPWSSAGFRVGERERDALVAERDRLGRAHDWRRWLRSDPAETALLRKAVRTGRPCGGAGFVGRAERRTGRSLRPGPRGRPRKDAEGAG